VILIKRALLSVHDKTGLVPLARTLSEIGCELISTGGTRKALEEAGLSVTDISSVTKNPEAFGGRVKTLSFQICGSLLFDRKKDSAEASRLGIEPLDLVVCNLYPFQKVWERGASLPELIEEIDIGGVTLIRAGAKNFAGVAVVVDPQDYESIGKELISTGGRLALETRRRLMRKAFHHVADYDAAISVAMDQQDGQESLRLSFTDGAPLRYGENPHQKARVYRKSSSFAPFVALQGKELSYNNYLDLQSAVDTVAGLSRPACAVIKHTNPCGIAEGDSLKRLLEVAWEGDPTSAFGSVIAFNRPLGEHDLACLELDHTDKSRRRFVEIVVAPEFSKEALSYMAHATNLRAVVHTRQGSATDVDLRLLDGLLLRQDRDSAAEESLSDKTNRPVDPSISGLIRFGINAVRQVKSNAIVIVRALADGTFQLLGMGSGQPNRVDSVRLAVRKARENLEREARDQALSMETHVTTELTRAVLVSDAFFPFPDSMDACSEAGVRTIIQPGGSIRDQAVIRRCDELGLSMAFTGRRHFKH